jgi:hypothetical protein
MPTKVFNINPIKIFRYTMINLAVIDFGDGDTAGGLQEPLVHRIEEYGKVYQTVHHRGSNTTSFG